MVICREGNNISWTCNDIPVQERIVTACYSLSFEMNNSIVTLEYFFKNIKRGC